MPHGSCDIPGHWHRLLSRPATEGSQDLCGVARGTFPNTGPHQRPVAEGGAAGRLGLLLDVTGNLKAAQKLLANSSIQTTGDVYADWDIDQLADTMRAVLEGEK